MGSISQAWSGDFEGSFNGHMTAEPLALQIDITLRVFDLFLQGNPLGCFLRAYSAAAMTI